MYYARALPSQSESSRWKKTRNGRQSSGARRARERVRRPFEPEPYGVLALLLRRYRVVGTSNS